MRQRALAALFVLAACGSPAGMSGDEPGCVPGLGADGGEICTAADYRYVTPTATGGRFCPAFTAPMGRASCQSKARD